MMSTVHHIKVTKRINSKSFYNKEFFFFSFASMRDDGCSLNLLWSSFHDYLSQIIMLYTSNLHSTMGQLYLKRTGKKENNKLMISLFFTLSANLC